MSPRVSLTTATSELARRDPHLAALADRVGPLRWRRRSADPYASLVEAIVYQQLAGKAAAAIHGRFLALFDGAGPTPAAVLVLSDESLRGVGLSNAKMLSIRDLSAHVADGRVDLAHVRRLGDEEIVTQLSAVRGIGRWTAQMFLIFQLRRLDVWPTGDLGVRTGYALMHDLAETPTPKVLEALGEPHRPFRSVAAMWCWEAVLGSRAPRALG
ncbi:MAG: DNA-3-methyladenine glycosylase family protein [Acidimicrobiales bacterium]